MKVILAGLNKTGTTSTVAAMQELGLNVHHYMENYENLRDSWMKIFTEGGSANDFRRMYQDVDAAGDIPVAYFWEEIHEAFPEAKIILTIRDNENIWVQSLKKQQDTFNTPVITMLRLFSPTYRQFYTYGATLGMAVFGTIQGSPLLQGNLNELLCKMSYRRHNAYVIQKAPKDKLLVYNAKEGWEPLCKFLGVDIASKPFPHKNVRGNLTEELLATNRTLGRAQREMKGSIVVLLLLSIYASYKAVKFLPSLSFLKRLLPS